MCFSALALLLLLLVSPSSARAIDPFSLPVLTEIMADPTPSRGLPAVEYLELYNPGQDTMQLDATELTIGSRTLRLPPSPLPPRAYVLLCHARDAPLLTHLGFVVGIDKFPRLTNSGTTIQLHNPATGQNYQIAYALHWYGEASYQAGGYSLEASDNLRPRNCAAAWRASRAPAGGSPGSLNSIAGEVFDEVPPRIVSVTLTASALSIRFDDWPDTMGLRSPTWLVAEPPLPLRTGSFKADTPVVNFPLAAPPDSQQLYQLHVLPDYSDCMGNTPAAIQTFPLALPRRVAAGDIVINEILYHPADGAADFIEIVNRSKKILSTQHWQWQHQSHASGSQTVHSFGGGALLLPGELRVYSADTTALRQHYPPIVGQRLFQQNLPNLPLSGGRLRLLDNRGQLIDAVSYSDSLHDPLLRSTRGISLERLDRDQPSDLPLNWYSSARGATPTLPNSQARTLSRPPASGSSLFSLPEPTFSPDGDGFEDLLVLQYDSPRPGLRASLTIFNVAGQPVHTLARQQLLAGRGWLRWDGRMADNRRAPLGIYLVVVEVFHPDGEVRREKYSCVLASKL